MSLPKTIQSLIEVFKNFPGVGPRQATRFAFYLLRSKKEEQEKFISAISDLKNIKFCDECGLSFENKDITLCHICNNPKRNKKIIAIIEKESDAETIEKTGVLQGVYHILNGNVLRDRDSIKIDH